MIRIQGLHKYFNKGKQNEIHVLNDMNLQLPEKGMVAIFGRSGCGKTTLLNVIGGLDSYAKGSLTIQGKDVRRDTDDLRNAYIGYIFQNYNLNKNESCFENVADALRLCGMNDPKEIEERVIAALANVGMDKYKNRTPDTLSGGQQQRIAIARAIVKNPRIILADEPTGNLDEANTVMIMDLLKAISRDHLVLLVTHEAHLVDHYCDMIVELSDGKILDVRANEGADGYSAKDKNDIYLGELPKTSIDSQAVEIGYYGDMPDSPIQVRIVRAGGKTYLKIDTPKVQILDESSEVKLREGVFEEKKQTNRVSEQIDMSRLPPVEGKRFGKLFTLGSSIKSGFRANFKKGKKGKVALFVAMISFAMVLVMMTSIFGTSIKALLDADEAYNHNVFYLYTPDGTVSDQLLAAMESKTAGIDYLRMERSVPNGDMTVDFHSGFFETFDNMYAGGSVSGKGVLLDASLIGDHALVAGEKTATSPEEIVVTTATADQLIESSSVGYIREYEDLLGLVTTYLSVEGKRLRIIGVVRSDETAFYLSEGAMASYLVNELNLQIQKDDVLGISLAEGEVALAVRRDYENYEYPEVGDTIKVNGMSLTVKELRVFNPSYPLWLEAWGIKKLSCREYFHNLLIEEQPSLAGAEDTAAYEEALSQLQSARYYEWYDYYAKELDSFFEEYCFFEPKIFEVWLATEKNVDAARISFLQMVEESVPEESVSSIVLRSEGYYYAKQYQKLYGRYPTLEEAKEGIGTLGNLQYDLNTAYQQYYSEFESILYGNKLTDTFNGSYCFLLSDEDYIACTKRVGETFSPKDSNEEYVKFPYYTVIHSEDPDKTAAYLQREFSDLTPEVDWYPVLVSPDSIFDDLIAEKLVSIISGLVTMAVVLVLLSICMYFIMRSSLMNRIKEVGIYRAIGVSKKNLLFRFFVESMVLTSLTVLIGYLAASLFVMFCGELSSLANSVFFYPLWLALAVLALLFGICVLCGIIPILSLLKKTPSQILAKYDI